MTVPKFLKRKSTYIILAIVLAGVGFIAYRHANPAQTAYETALVKKQDLAQTVEVTGELKPADRIELAFKTAGTIDAIKVKTGDIVKAGQVLAELKDADLQYALKNAQATLAIASANLRQKQAGATSQDIRVSETQVEQAQASYEKAQSDLISTQATSQDAIKQAELALQTAQNNLNNQQAIVDQNLQNASDSARTSLLTAIGPLNTGLTDGDQITGVDNTAANQSYVNVLGFLDQSAMPTAKAAYTVAKNAKLTAQTAVQALSVSSKNEDIQNAATKLGTAITLTQAYLTNVQAVLAASLTSSQLTATQLTAFTTQISADRTAVSAQNTAVLSALQSITNSGLTRTQTVQQLQDAYNNAVVAENTAKTNAEVQVKNAQTAIAIQKANLDATKAQLDLKRSGPRSVDLAPLQASVEQALANVGKATSDLSDAQIIAPVDGIVSDIVPSVGEQASPNAAAISMVGTSSYDIEAKVPEADITKIAVNQKGSITLDAYGDEVKFNGIVTTKDPAETRVQDAVYYNIRVQIDPAGKEVKPGMTANVTITTASSANTLVIPLRAVRTLTAADGSLTKHVRVLVNGKPEDRTIVLGLKGDEGQAEVLSGLSEGDNVIVSDSSAVSISK